MTGAEPPELTIGEIDQDISKLQATLSSAPPSSGQYAALLATQATLRMLRFLQSGNRDELDLETSILQYTRAIFLPLPLSTKDDANVILTLFKLTHAFYIRSRKHERANDVSFCVKYLHFIRAMSCKSFGVSRNRVTTFLVDALALQMNLEPVNTMQNVEEMSALCLELLSLDLPNADLENTISRFSVSLMDGRMDRWIQPSQQVIECLREANMRLPRLHVVSFAIFHSFVHGFYITASMEDYENAMAVLEEILARHSASPDLGQALFQAAQAAWIRSAMYDKPEYLEEAIVRCRAYLRSTSPGDPHRDHIIRGLLVQLERSRFDTFGVTSGLLEAHSNGPEAVDIPSFPRLVASLVETNVFKSPLTLKDHIPHYQAILAMNHITNEADIEEAVKYGRLLLKEQQQGPPSDVMQATHLTVYMLGNFFQHAFRLTNTREYLDEAIDIYRSLIKTPAAKLFHWDIISQLILSLSFLSLLTHDRKDVDEIMRLFHIAATDANTDVPSRFEISCSWAWSARALEHFSTSTAYKSAISLIQDSLAFAPTLEIQHFRLIAMRKHIEKLPSDCASYQVHIGQLQDAIEVLERGRGLLWSELRGLRTSIDQLHTVNPGFALKFAAINRGLEELTVSGSADVWSNDGDVYGGEEMDPFGRTLMNQRKLLDERTSLITQIRSLPGLEDFLIAPSFDTLRSAAAHGPVIIINHCHYRSDIIILLYNSPPSLIPTPNNFYDHATGLKEQLLAARKKGRRALDSEEYEDTLTSVLQTLYDLVGRPVIRRLQELNVPEQSRIWWCPTSVFCSLPLHAMGPVRSDGHLKLYFLDLYIPSYTPTLSALIESRKSGAHSFEKPSILLVAQPDELMPAAWREISLVRGIETTVTTLCSKKATPSAVMKQLQIHRFAHFACHGILEAGKPFDASFKLYQGERLTLLEIIRSRLPSAEFAFLSACHTAELTEESIADEGLHLCAAVQYSGFRSVVGTMWAMADEDGPVVTKNFYESLFSERWQGVPYYERTAEALRDAVRKLRIKGVATERWVNFVHYGA